MSKLVELDATLRLYEQNFRNLHWNAKGNDFNDSHKSITTEYYEMISADVDKVAEMEAIMGIDPLNFTEAADFIVKSEKKYITIQSDKHYTRAEIIEIANTMLLDICAELAAAIEEISNPLDAGVRAELENLLYAYTLQARYINKRRMEE